MGKSVGGFLEFIGEATLVGGGAIRRILQADVSLRDTVCQMAAVGVNSIPIVVVTTAFSGAVLAL